MRLWTETHCPMRESSPDLDVVALRRHLTSQRNEAVFLAGALVIGPQLLAHQDKLR